MVRFHFEFGLTVKPFGHKGETVNLHVRSAEFGALNIRIRRIALAKYGLGEVGTREISRTKRGPNNIAAGEIKVREGETVEGGIGNDNPSSLIQHLHTKRLPLGATAAACLHRSFECVRALFLPCRRRCSCGHILSPSSIPLSAGNAASR